MLLPGVTVTGMGSLVPGLEPHFTINRRQFLIGAGVSPDQILWDFDTEMGELFATPTPLPPVTRRIKAPQSFVEMANWVVWHKDPQRFARLYALLWRLRHQPGLMQDRADP